MNLTAAQLSLLRNQSHRTNLYLSIYRPDTLMTAQVTGSYGTGNQIISYYNASGTYFNLYPDIAVKIGTTPGGDDVGRLRMRNATGTYVQFAENSITWQSDMYLTFLDYVDVTAVYPRIVQDSNNATNVIFYKDWEIPYSNQNSIYGTFPCAGPHRALFLQSGTATSYWTGTGTYNVAGQGFTYEWNFGGGSPTGSLATSPGNITYTQPGNYKTRLRITAPNGAVDDTFRYVSVYNRPGEGSSTPILKWELQNFSGSRGEGGYTASIKVYENIDYVEPNALIVIFADTWYGGTKTNIGGNAPNNASIVFVGYILGDSIKFDYKSSSVEFKVGSVSELMKEVEGFSVSCESKATPTTWFELQEMTVPKAIYHYLRWHSTILKVTDFQYTADDRLVQYFDADRGSLYDAVDSFMRDGMLGSVISDRQGKLWAQISPFGLQTPFTDIPNNFTFHKQDWIGQPSIEERRNSEMSFVEMGGIVYYGVSSNTFAAVLANAPATAPLYHGKSESPVEGLILLSQQQLNQIAGNYLAHNNTRFPNVGLQMAGAYLNLDIAPLEQARLVIDANDSVRGKSIQDLRYIVDGMEWNYNARDEMFRPDVTLLQIATGTTAQTVLIPPAPPDGGYGYPDINLPPLPNFDSPNGQIPSGVSRSVIFVDGHASGYTGKGVIYTTDFDSASPTWFTMNGGLTVSQYENINKVIVCPNGAVYAAYEGSWSRGASDNHFIAYAPKLGAPWTIIVSEATVEAEYAGSGDSLRIDCLSCRKDLPESVLYIAGRGVPPFSDTSNVGVYLGSHSSFTKTMTIADMRISGPNSFESFYMKGKWAIVYSTVTGVSQSAKYHRLNAGATAETAVTNIGGFAGTVVVAADTTGIIYATQDTDPLSTTFRASLNNGDTWSILPSTSDVKSGAAGFACDDTGQFIMAEWTNAGARGKSSDYGTTFVGLPTLPFGGGYVWGYMGGVAAASQWVVISAAVIRYSPDFGNTWLNREGNISTIIPINGNTVLVYPIRTVT